MAINVGDLVATLSLDDKMSKSLMSAGDKMSKLGQGMAIAGGAATGLGTAIVAAMAPSIVAAAKYETALTQIKALTIASSEDVKRWGKDILALSTEVGKSPQELAEALYFIASSGQVGATGFEILRMSAKMAALNMGQTADIARGIVSAINAYGKENLSAAQAADILTRSVIEGGAQATEYANVLGRILPMMSILNVSLAEGGAFMATFTRLGVKGSEAATALRGALQALAAPGKEASEALEAIGLSGEILRKSLAEDGLVAVLELIMERTKGNMDQLDKIIPNVRALTGVLGAAGKQSAEYARILGTVKNSQGQLEKSFGEWGKTTAAQWSQLQAALQSAAVELGTALLPLVKDLIPYLKSMAETVRDVIGWFAGLDEGTRRLIGTFVLFGGPVLIGMGAFLMVLGQIAFGLGALGVSGAAAIPIIGQIVVAIGAFVIVERAAAWFVDAVPGLRAFTDTLVTMAAKVTGLQLVLDLYYSHLAKGKDVQEGFTEEEKKALEALKKHQEAVLAQEKALGAMTVATEKVIPPTKKVIVLTEEEKKARAAAAELAKKHAFEMKSLNYELDGQVWALEQTRDMLNRYFAVYVDMSNVIPLTTKEVDDFNASLGEIPPMVDVLGPAIAKGAREAGKELEELDKKVKAIRFQGLIEGAALFAEMIGGDLGATVGVLGNIADEFSRIGEMAEGAEKDAAKLNAVLTAIGQIGAILSNSATPAVQKFGGALQGAAAGAKMGTAILPVWGTAIGGLVGGIFGFINAGKKLRKELEDIKGKFFESMGGVDALKRKALEAGVSIESVFAAKNKNTLLAAIDEVKKRLDTWDEANQKLQAAIEKYGITVEELGPKFAQQEMDKKALSLIESWKLLEAAGVQVGTLVAKMGPDMSAFVEQAFRAGTQIPLSMKPMIEKLWEAGKLLHEDGTAFTEAEYRALSFGATTTQMFETLLAKLDEWINALMGIPNREVVVHTTYTSSGQPAGGAGGGGGGGGGGGASGGGEEESPYEIWKRGGRVGPRPEGYATGGIAMTPQLAYVGEAGPEAIVPLPKLRQDEMLATLNAIYHLLRNQPELLSRAVRDGLAMGR